MLVFLYLPASFILCPASHEKAGLSLSKIRSVIVKLSLVCETGAPCYNLKFYDHKEKNYRVCLCFNSSSRKNFSEFLRKIIAVGQIQFRRNFSWLIIYLSKKQNILGDDSRKKKIHLFNSANDG